MRHGEALRDLRASYIFDAGLSGKHSALKFLHTIADRRDNTIAGDNYLVHSPLVLVKVGNDNIRGHEQVSKA
jgi:hypothetical protein